MAHMPPHLPLTDRMTTWESHLFFPGTGASSSRPPTCCHMPTHPPGAPSFISFTDTYGVLA